MNCRIELSPRAGHILWCPRCKRPIAADETRECTIPGERSASEPSPEQAFTADELRKIFGAHDARLLGNKIAALTKALGWPPCGACDDRRDYMNRAEVWIRTNLLGQ